MHGVASRHLSCQLCCQCTKMFNPNCAGYSVCMIIRNGLKQQQITILKDYDGVKSKAIAIARECLSVGLETFKIY